MAKGIMVVQSRPKPGREDEYHRWYDDEHVPAALEVPTFVGAARYRQLSPPTADGTPGFLAVYQIEADDIEAAVAELRAHLAQSPRGVAVSDDPPPVVTLYELLDERAMPDGSA